MIFIELDQYGNQGIFDLQGESINQGNNRINEIFVTFGGYPLREELRALTCTFTFSLPSRKRIDNLASTLTTYTYQGFEYNGYRFTMTDAETTEAGLMQCTIKLFDDTKVLASTSVGLNVNPNDATGDAEPNITQEQYNQLLQEMNNKVSSENGVSKGQRINDASIVKGEARELALTDSIFYRTITFNYVTANGSINLSTDANSIIDFTKSKIYVPLGIDKNDDNFDNQPISYSYLVTSFLGRVRAEYISAIDSHNTSPTAHSDIRTLVSQNTAQIITNRGDITDIKQKDVDLQKQIDDINASQNSVDMVGTYSDLLAYDTSKLKDGDIITIIADENHNGQTSYYKWYDSEWHFLASVQFNGYTKAESDNKFATKNELDAEKINAKNYTDTKATETTDNLTSYIDNKTSGLEETSAEIIKALSDMANVWKNV